LSPLADQEVSKEEFEYYQLMIEATEIGMEEGGVSKSVDRYWGEIMKIKTLMGQRRWCPKTKRVTHEYNIQHK